MSDIKAALRLLSVRQDLSAEMAENVMNEIMAGDVSEPQIAAYLMGLTSKNESVSEITGSAKAMLNQAVNIAPEFDAMDIVGTGGDMSNTFNISTTASFIVAAAGVPIAKHGNRAASSKSGTADVLEALGVTISLTADQATQVLRETGQTFLFARSFHPAMKIVGPIRKNLGIRTVFNVLGPLINPMRPKSMLLGVYSKQLLVPLAHVLIALGVKNAILIHGKDGLDEVTLTDKTDMVVLRNQEITESEFDPMTYGFDYVLPEELLGGTPTENAEITQAILSGRLGGAKKEVVILNAAMALFAANICENLQQSITLARSILENGKAYQHLIQLQQATKAVSA
ncbi:anthranilate phosphoribosyltransferase [Leuconostoc sp. MS02]|uniref:Anthranilate phosphoribosyltransferase n=1 Tax=Leuconostoc aquikimchii TaxID=3236804 RepID=A0ABV3S2V0_9LACO